jgi:hypothetical protein
VTNGEVALTPSPGGVEIVLFTTEAGPLTKRISLDAEGQLQSDGTACVMRRGTAKRVRVKTLHQFANLIHRLHPHQAIALGSLREGLPEECEVVTDFALRRVNGTPRPNVIARTQLHICFSSRAGLLLVDFDQKGMPPAIKHRIAELGGFEKALRLVLPAIATAGTISRGSTSAGLFRTDTGERFSGSGGKHLYIQIADVADSARALKALHQRCWLAGLGWLICGVAGQLLERSLVDHTVGSPERLVFEGPPVLGKPLDQDHQARIPVVHEGEILDTAEACPPLTIVELAKLDQLLARESQQLVAEAAKAREHFIKQHAAHLSKRTGVPITEATRVIARQCRGVLLPDVVLPFDDQELADTTVADVLADPARFEGETLADPIQGPDYGACRAKIMRRADGTPWIHSFAHGRTVYELRYNFAATKAALEKAPENQAANTFVDLILLSDLDPDEVEHLRDLTAERAGVGKRAIERKLRAARQERAAQRVEEERRRHLADRRDPRPQIEAPLPDAEWLPQMATINDVLGKSTAAEPPARDIDGVVAYVRVRRVPNMHMLTSLGANDEELRGQRLPPPEQPLLTRYSEPQLAELIEEYIEYVHAETGRSVHLGAPYVHHFHTRPNDDALPIIAAIAGLPIVMPDATLLAGRGLDKKRGIAFRIPNELLSLLPDLKDCTPGAVARAMQFLCDEWLCDVAADYVGKCILVTAALTLIERSLLPDRPVFFVTAGRRGGGKTTTLIMLLMAVSGIRPAAAAWSSNEEERRKALFAYLLEAVPAIVWDNIPRGSQLSCPHIEKSCTSAFYSDRRLGVSEQVVVSAATIHLFTGNNIGPRGDLASRALTCRLEVERPDPENRKFKHPDPIAWTEIHRGQILAALYTILLGNPRLREANPPAAETRFKMWWHLCSSAVENAAKQHSQHVEGLVGEKNETCPPRHIKFKDLFLEQEEDEEESASLADALEALATQWPDNKTFQSIDVSRLININPKNDGLFNDTPEREKERAAVLREYLFPTLSPGQTVTAQAVTRRLKTHIGEPVRRGGKILILRKGQNQHSKIIEYHVVAKR